MEEEFGNRLRVTPNSSNGAHSPSALSVAPFPPDGNDDSAAAEGMRVSSPEDVAPELQRISKRRVPDMQLGKCRWVRLFDNVTYIVAAIVLRQGEDGSLEILLTQEAKKKCYGKWPGASENYSKKRAMSALSTILSRPKVEVQDGGWHNVDAVLTSQGTEKDSASLIPLRCRDFFPVVEEAVRYYRWKNTTLTRSLLSDTQFHPILNVDECSVESPCRWAKRKGSRKKIECLVHGDITDEDQIISSPEEAFPTVEFGLEFFFPMVVSKCYRHIFNEGHKTIDLPEAVIGMWCLPVPPDTIHQGLRLRILARHKKATQKAQILAPHRYHWLSLNSPSVLAFLYMLPEQYRPKLTML